jgi:hypothetical protein
VLLAEEVRDAVIRFQIGASLDRHGLKSGSAVEMKYLETAQRLQEGVLKKCYDEIEPYTFRGCIMISSLANPSKRRNSMRARRQSLTSIVTFDSDYLQKVTKARLVRLSSSKIGF